MISMARILLILFLLSATLTLHALDEPKVARAKYDELAAKVNAGDMNIDWQILRLSARVGEVYGDYDPYRAAKEALALHEKGDYEGALKIAIETERHNIADLDAQVAAWSCLMQMERKQEAERHWNILRAIVQSILKSGKGKNAKTAYFVVGIREELVFIEEALQSRVTQQHSERIDGHYYDVVSVVNAAGKKDSLWFNTDTDIELSGRAGDTGRHIY
jgi:tetratricopeptide (TPR) repeat protein